MKKLMILLLVVGAMLGAGADTWMSGDCTVTLDGAGTLTVSGNGPMADYDDSADIPWYGNRNDIRKIVIGNGVTTIGKRAFYECLMHAIFVGEPPSGGGSGDPVQTIVSIPASVTAIGDYAFGNCDALTAVAFPEDSLLTTIGRRAFQYCYAMADIDIPASVTMIGDEAFYSCDALTTVAFPEDSRLETIGNEVFRGCDSLVAMSVPENVASMGDSVFYDCPAVADVYCYPDAESLTWSNAKWDFKEDGSTRIHVKKNQLATYLEKFGERVRGIFVGDLSEAPEPVAPPTPPAPPAGGSAIAAGPRPTFVGSFEDEVASVWDGWTVSGGALGGVLQVKVSKSNGKKPAKVTATFIQAANGRKLSYKGEMDAVGGSTATLTFNGMTDFSFPIVVTLQFAENALKGSFGGDRVVGARNLFQSKDKQEAKAAEVTLAPHLGAVNVVFGGGTLSLSVAKKGKVKVSGLLDDGTKVSATAQLIIGDEGLAIPVLVTKKADLAFLVWLSGGTATVEGLDGVTAAGAPKPKDSLTFSLGAGFGTVAGVQAGLLPTAFAFGGGLKWSFRKADTVKLVDGAAAVTKDNGNPSGLKLTYKPKDGSFKGPFKVYVVEGGKLKKYTANVTGVMVGGKGYGTAEIKKPAVSATVTIE